MTTMTMPAMVERTQSNDKHKASQLIPFLLAMVLVAAAGVVSILLSGPLH